jgi:hypothetical protein
LRACAGSAEAASDGIAGMGVLGGMEVLDGLEVLVMGLGQALWRPEYGIGGEPRLSLASWLAKRNLHLIYGGFV